MYNENDIRNLVTQVVEQLNQQNGGGVNSPQVVEKAIATLTSNGSQVCEGEIPDITAFDLKDLILVKNPHDMEALKKMKQTTPARIGVYRAGPRYKTETLLRFRADHAAAMDAVFSSVSDAFLSEMNLPMVKTICKDKDEYLTRPDFGREFDAENKALIQKINPQKPQVLIYASDGLSSTAIEANLRDILPVITQGLKASGVSTGTPFFVKFGRVPAMDAITEFTGAEVTCLLIGERPGLVTAESMSCYMTYKATVGMPEARRTVVSNIHRQGTAAVEAGAHIVDILKLMLSTKSSGLDLKL